MEAQDAQRGRRRAEKRRPARKRLLSIGELARAVGVAVQTVRWYEREGLLPEPLRTPGNQRRYERAALERLSFIRHARDLGLSLADIRALLALADNPSAPCEEANAIIERELVAVREKIARLRALEREFARMLDECPADEVRRCRVIEILSDHALCRHHEYSDADGKKRQREGGFSRGRSDDE